MGKEVFKVEVKVEEVNNNSDWQLGKQLMNSNTSQSLELARSRRDATALTTLPAVSPGGKKAHPLNMHFAYM